MSIKVYNIKKQKIRYAYNKTKQFEARLTNNISSICFTGQYSNVNLAKQLVDLQNLNDNVLELSNYALKDCINLSAVDLSKTTNLSSIGDECFNGCVNMQTLTLPATIKNIGKNCFKNCRNMKSLDFNGYECHVDDFSDPQLEYANENILDGTTKLEQIVFPQSLAKAQDFSQVCLKNSNAKRVVLLGMTNVLWTAESKLLGLNKDCELYTTSKKNTTSTDDSKYLYLASSGSLTKDSSYSIYQGVASAATAGRTRLRKPNIFSESAVEWCVNPSVRSPSDKIQSKDICPIIVIYLDVLTSSKSYKFFINVLKDNNFTKLLKQKLNCYVFILFRNGDIKCTNSDLMYFKNTLNANILFSHDFVSVNFYYGNKFNTFTADENINTADFVDQLVAYADQTQFSTFNYKEFDIKLEEPYEEEIPFGSSSAASNYKPWWFNNGSVAAIQDWNT